MLKKLLAFASIVEIGTGLALMVDPRLVVALLLGADVSGVGNSGRPLLRHRVARAGTGVLAERAASAERFARLPGDAGLQRADRAVPRLPVHGRHRGGVLLWPAVVLHAVVALLLVWTWRTERLTKATTTNGTGAYFWQVIGLMLALALVGAATAQGPAPATKGADAPALTEKHNVDVLKGIWVRPDGGYTIVIKGVGPSGQLDAMYFNPSPLPFAKAQASSEGATLRAFFELRAGGYDGSTYELTYDPASERLKGIYYQAVAKQKFDVYFARK